MVYFPSLGGGGFSLASAGGGVVVEALDLNRRIDGWPNGDIWLFWMGAHGCPAINDKIAPAKVNGSRARVPDVVVPALTVGGSKLLEV